MFNQVRSPVLDITLVQIQHIACNYASPSSLATFLTQSLWCLFFFLNVKSRNWEHLDLNKLCAFGCVKMSDLFSCDIFWSRELAQWLDLFLNTLCPLHPPFDTSPWRVEGSGGGVHPLAGWLSPLENDPLWNDTAGNKQPTSRRQLFQHCSINPSARVPLVERELL